MTKAFRISYNRIVREIKTDAVIIPPAALLNYSKPVEVNAAAIWDTGATRTAITNKIVRLLDLKPIGKAIVFGVNSKAIVNRYIVDIRLPNEILVSNCEVLGSDFSSPGVDLLIGMDIIQKGDFAISNVDGKTTFSFCIPPLKPPIDLFEKSKE
ncbi:MAG: hypothetical protein GTO45_11230 [Candidatus Aminicenantes bacterium]|nr:hypothetical protein [Candidatus Aminicenantes bacterium]NIM79390.1 hypothetical protein [Candidatus Aminicenantes bacterium]NIN18667.1 hypothetical protein [Candidatus Aminicenantes bacterium]NIN42556.1 hypothetical protein [Candidatus Aminicenantes bacterium]NIN85322.1 hypothetical protein [Candidatus Aminicenantes bacterium]